MRICIMHFASSLLRILLATNFFLEFWYGILLVLSRCCFHHLVENSILYKKDIQHFYIGPILFQKIKSYSRWSAEKLTVKFYLAPGVRNGKFYVAPGMRNGKIYLAPNDSYEKFYLAVKGLITDAPSEQCSFDSILTWLLNECVTYIAQVLAHMVSKTLSCIDEVPTVLILKTIITLILKTPNLDKADLANYRPMLNLPFISKILEKVVAI